MKKLKLLLAMCALMGGVFSANAEPDWTDKTSLITNPSFETDDAISNLTSCGWATDRATGWTIAPSSPSNAQVGVGNSSSTIQGIATSFSPSDGDKYFYMRENWNPNTTFSISQTIPDGSIPAGIYRLTVKAAMFSSVASTYTLSLQEEGKTAATNSFSYKGSANNENWKDWSVMLIKQEDNTDLIITAAFKTPSENSSNKNYSLLLDDVKLEYLASVSSTNTFDMTSWVVNPSFELNTFNGTQASGSSIGNSGGTINKPTGYTCYFNIEGWRDCSSNTTNPADGTYCMNAWFGTINEMKFYQTIDYLPEGVYEISAQVRTNETSTNGIYTYGVANDKTYKSASWDASKMADTWNSMDNWQTLTARASVIGGGSLQFGLRSDTFIQFDDFHLTYLGSDLLISEATAVWTTVHNNLAALDATALPDAAETAITTELEKQIPSKLAEIESATNALQALIDSYDGIKSAFDEYKALKATIEDLKNTSKYTFTGTEALSTFNSTLSTIDGNAEAATDAATLTDLLPSLKTAGNTFVGSIESSDGFDLTYNIVNNSFETGALSPWTTNGSNDTGVKPNSNETYTTTGVDGSYLFNTWNNGAGSKVSQTLSSLPNGYYTVTALVASDAGNTINILAGATTKTVDADGTSGKTQFVEGTTDKTIVCDGSLEIGTNSTTWYKSDNFRLTYYTVKAGAAEAWTAAKAAAEAASTNPDYTNVTGSERTTLNTEIAKAEPTTAAEYGTATIALQEATSALIDAKSNYNALVAEITKATALGVDASSYAVTSSTTATSALTNTQNLKVAEYNYVTDNYPHGYPLGEWTSTGTNTRAADFDNEHWSGTIHTYKNQDDTNGQGWNAQSWTINFSQDVTIPAGNYVFKVAGRQASGDKVTTSLVVKVGETTLGTVNDFPRSNNSRGINKDGATSFDPNDEAGFANNSNGFGWEWRYVKFTLEEDATVNIAVNSVATDYHQWVSFGDYTLQTDNEGNISRINYNVALENAKNTIANDAYTNVIGSERTALQDAIDADETLNKDSKDAIEAATEVLNNAISAFTDAKSAYDTHVEAKTREYANDLPYASEEAFEAIATAQAEDATSADDAVAKTAAITAAYRKYIESHALAEGVSGAEPITINDYRFANMTDEDIDAGNWKIGDNWFLDEQNNGTIHLSNVGSFTDGDGNADYNYIHISKNDNNAGIHQNVTLDHGHYMMTVTARCRSGQDAQFKAFAGDDFVYIPQDDNTNGQFGRGWNDVSVEFDVAESSDVNIGVRSYLGKDIWWSATRFRLVRLGNVQVTIDEKANYTATAASSADVTLTRTFAFNTENNYWKTFVVPFDINNDELKAAFGNDVEVAEYSNSNTENIIYFNTMTTTPPSIKANTPVLLKNSKEVTNYTFKNRTITVEDPIVEGSNFNFVGTYTPGYIEEGDYFISANKLVQAGDGSNTIKGTRAYITAKSPEARIAGFFIDGVETTNIEGVSFETADGLYYNLNGQRVTNPKKGLYIVNGKKTYIK